MHSMKSSPADELVLSLSVVEKKPWVEPTLEAVPLAGTNATTICNNFEDFTQQTFS